MSLKDTLKTIDQLEKVNHSVQKLDQNAHKNWLNLMFLGGAIFGFLDHLWNGELFLIGPNLFSDLALGFTITAGIIGSWGIINYTPKITDLMRNISYRLGISR